MRSQGYSSSIRESSFLLFFGLVLAVVSAHGMALRGNDAFHATELGSSFPSVFSDKEVSECGRVRVPELVQTPSRILLFVQCRGMDSERMDESGGIVGDDMRLTRMVSKESKDGGKSWENFTYLTPKGFSHGNALYDYVEKTVVFQYQYHPDKDPSTNTTYFQRISHDDGRTWSSEVDITQQLRSCNPHAPYHMQDLTAGSKIQAKSGRLLFVGHNDETQVCVWYSDDHGKTYHTTSLFPGSETSMAELTPGLLMLNGRGAHFTWKPHRTTYLSRNDGMSWDPPFESPLVDDSEAGSEGALISISTSNSTGMPTLFFSEPKSKGRTDLTLHCSHDGGKSWPASLSVTPDEEAEYSALLHVPKSTSSTLSSDHPEILIVWEKKPTMRYTRVGTSWCFS